MNTKHDADTTVEALDYFSLPAALVDLTADRFLSWNKSFVDAIGAGSGEVSLLKVSAVAKLVWEPRSLDQSSPADGAVASAVCSVKRLLGNEIRLGRAFKRAAHFVLLVLDSETRVAATNDFLRGVALGSREENERISQGFHDFISHQILLIAFEAHSLTRRLRTEGVRTDPEMSRMVAMLDELINDIQEVLTKG
jgi:signal transduction histidine kinase